LNNNIMSNDSVLTNENTNLKIEEDYKNEKLKKRCEQLEAWRLKKQQVEPLLEQKPSIKIKDTIEERRKSKKKKSKKKQQEQQSSKSSPKTQQNTITNHQFSKNKTAMSISKKASTVKPPLRKRIEFEGEEDHSNSRKKPKFEIPKTENNALIEDDSESVDELDVFINQLNSNNSKPTLIEEEVQIYSDSEEDEKEEDLQNRIDSKLAKLGNTKILKEIDQSKIIYKPFEKIFYQVPFEMSLMSHEEIELLRYWK
ncbi:hypothetical protein KGF54_001092, partial [Candida jiufengensis]|uniref:uncharacterized protein n=1 Tax=Candida jiufengensis TaxID=497108 RepID=UPI00222540E3